MRMDIAAQTDIGRHKKNNEDYYGIFREDTPGLQLFDEGALLCVADGLGGHVGGEIASKLAVSVFKDCLKEARPSLDALPPAPEPSGEGDQAPARDPYDEAVLSILRNAIVRANDSIFQTNRDVIRSVRPMGTTFLGALVLKHKVYVATVGDSRFCLFRDNNIVAMTEDHSWVDEQVKLGLMSRAEAESDTRRNIVTRCIGTHAEVAVDTYVWDLQQGDKLLLCTDGLINMVKDADIRDLFSVRAPAADLAHRLVNQANENGGRDNITVIVAYVRPNLWHFLAIHWTSLKRRHGKKILWTMITLLLCTLSFFGGYCVREFNLLNIPLPRSLGEILHHPTPLGTDEPSSLPY